MVLYLDQFVAFAFYTSQISFVQYSVQPIVRASVNFKKRRCLTGPSSTRGYPFFSVTYIVSPATFTLAPDLEVYSTNKRDGHPMSSP